MYTGTKYKYGLSLTVELLSSNKNKINVGNKNHETRPQLPSSERPKSNDTIIGLKGNIKPMKNRK